MNDPIESILSQKHLEDVQITVPLVRPGKAKDPDLSRKLDQAIAELIAEREEDGSL